ncbi:MAG: hypothetical protein Q9160_002766 [Pyrenula sp. 1 TL-2023]
MGSHSASQDEGESPFPFPLTDIDRYVLSQTDEEFHYHSWDELKQIIAEHNLSILKRRPSDLRRYMAWSAETKRQYGSMTNFICRERLHWPLLPESTAESGPLFAFRNATPFVDKEDYKIMPNDWPYGLEPGIVHIVVWLKTPLPSTPERGDLTTAGILVVESFVCQNFGEKLAERDGCTVDAVMGDKVMWFKNWKSLQSVPGLEHVHVLLRNCGDDVINDLTGGITPLQEQIKSRE